MTPFNSSTTPMSSSLPRNARSTPRALTEALPCVILMYTAKYLSPRSLDLLAMVCKSLKTISDSTFKSYLNPNVVEKFPSNYYSQLFKNPVNRKLEFVPFDYHFEGVDYLSDHYMIYNPEYIQAIKLKQFDMENFKRIREQRIKEIQEMIFPEFAPVRELKSYGFAELYINDYLSQTQLTKLNGTWIAILERTEIREQIYKRLITIDALLASGMDGTLNDGTPKHSLLLYRVIIDYLDHKLFTFQQLVDSGISEQSHPDILKILAHPTVRAAFGSGQLTLQQVANSDDATEAFLS